MYTSLKQLPVIAFTSDNLYKNDSSQHGSILFLAYNSCPGHEHFSTVQDVTSPENLITVGEDEDQQTVTADGSETITDDQFAKCAINEKLSQDKHGREHLRYPHTGPVIIYIRNNVFHENTCLENINDLYPICMEAVRNGKGIFHAYVDNGPDYSPASYKNLILFGCLWRGSNLGIFNEGSHASGQSAFNDIEHAWALMSRHLTCVTLSACEEGDTVPPCQNSSLNEEEKKQKEEKTLDKAAEEIRQPRTYVVTG